MTIEESEEILFKGTEIEDMAVNISNTKSMSCGESNSQEDSCNNKFLRVHQIEYLFIDYKIEQMIIHL